MYIVEWKPCDQWHWHQWSSQSDYATAVMMAYMMQRPGFDTRVRGQAADQ
jgi:hypothetical protein